MQNNKTIYEPTDLLINPFLNSIFFSTLGIFTDKLIISDPVELHDRSFMAHLNQLPWTAPLFTRRVEQTVLTGKHMTFCRVSNESISVVSVSTIYNMMDIWSPFPSLSEHHFINGKNNYELTAFVFNLFLFNRQLKSFDIQISLQ